jgi:antirestriction protein ArdC
MPATTSHRADRSTTSQRTSAPQRKNAAQSKREDYQQPGGGAERKNPVQQLINQAVDSLIQQLKAGKSNALIAYLAAMARFHRYSFGNIMAIARQCPTATRVAGYQTWKELGRQVKKGEQGIQIFAPMVVKRRKNDTDEFESEENPHSVITGFRPVYVWDQSQTDGCDVPEFNHTVSGEVGSHRDRLIDFLAQQSIALEYDEKIAPALGVSYGGRIALLPGQSQAEEFATLTHEAAHELLHRSERRASTAKTVRETEAEAVAFIVGHAIGLEMGTTSSDYIQLYAGDASLLAESLELIQSTSAMILSAIQPEPLLSKRATDARAIEVWFPAPGTDPKPASGDRHAKAGKRPALRAI